MKTLVEAVEAKGGVGKSLSIELAISTLKGLGKSIATFECDSSNATTTSRYPDTKFVDLESIKAVGSLVTLFSNAADFGVMDTGARDEKIIRKAMPAMIETAAQTKCQIVVLRPITLDVSVHKNATEFAKDYCPEGVKIVFLRSVACGRSSDAFKRRWDKYENKNKLVASGAAFEMDLEDLGAEYAENLSFVKKPLRDVVAGRFDHLSAKSQLEAKEIYDADARAHIALWLKAHEAKFAEALRALGVKL